MLDTKSIEDIYAEIREVYVSSKMPWVIGYSGGKDSTATLQLIWYALAGLPVEQRHKPVYVIASDTLVETPVIVDYLDATLRRINESAKEAHMPFEAQKVVPQTTDTFWVNLIGRGYPAPNQRFRWCTERMKIQPANRFILDRAAEFGEVVMVLGGRKSESASRAQVLNSHHGKVTGSRLRRHHILTRAYVYGNAASIDHEAGHVANQAVERASSVPKRSTRGPRRSSSPAARPSRTISHCLAWPSATPTRATISSPA